MAAKKKTKKTLEPAELAEFLDAPPVCFATDCYSDVAVWVNDSGYCVRHAPAARPAGSPPALPDLGGHMLEFHTPPGRRGMYCQVSFALLLETGVVVRRTADRTDDSVCYSLAGSGDLAEEQYAEVGSRAWYPVTQEVHEMLRSHDPEAGARP